MTPALLIHYCSTLVWIFPPIRQYRGNFFYFFLILAFCDIIAPVAQGVFHYNPSIVYIFGSYFLILSIVGINLQKPNILSAAVGFLITFLLVYSSWLDLIWIIVIIHLVIVCLIIKSVLAQFIIEHKAGIFHILLILYELTIIFKFLFLILEESTGYLFFYSTTFVQIAFGIAFMIFSDFEKASQHGVQNK
ncbi:MAG: hypothetical protein HF314_12225 [Ignavibacteria bacterium]|jgi:hypothetical protein|nr:hypothetical protein [Ignavibacteria bacterium]MCU7503838.1 hypothetical protein [Ignavibacteria bacterium]MCU7515941.1 hypothetical protein [Ignavibacteria bacterium]